VSSDQNPTPEPGPEPDPKGGEKSDADEVREQLDDLSVALSALGLSVDTRKLMPTRTPYPDEHPVHDRFRILTLTGLLVAWCDRQLEYQHNRLMHAPLPPGMTRDPRETCECGCGATIPLEVMSTAFLSGYMSCVRSITHGDEVSEDDAAMLGDEHVTSTLALTGFMAVGRISGLTRGDARLRLALLALTDAAAKTAEQLRASICGFEPTDGEEFAGIPARVHFAEQQLVDRLKEITGLDPNGLEVPDDLSALDEPAAPAAPEQAATQVPDDLSTLFDAPPRDGGEQR